MKINDQTTAMIDSITSFMENLSRATEWLLVVIGVILFCYTFAKGTAEQRAADRSIPGN